MTSQTTNNDLLSQVHEDMDVYDRDGHKVGKVNDVFMGAVADAGMAGGEPERGSAPMEPGDGSLASDVARVFSDNMPDVLRNRMRHNGFVRISGGLLSGDRFALREQVAAVEGDRVTLNVKAEELIKR